MTRIPFWLIVIVAVVPAVLASRAISAQDKYTVQVLGGLAFSEFRGFEDWQTVSVSQTEGALAAILANPVLIDAYRAGVPGDGSPFPDGSMMAKIHWKPEKSAEAPDPTTRVPGALHDVDFMVRDSKRFADSGGWGWAAFNYDSASDTFTPAFGRQPPAGERCQVRVRLPYDREGKGLRLHGVSEEVRLLAIAGPETRASSSNTCAKTKKARAAGASNFAAVSFSSRDIAGAWVRKQWIQRTTREFSPSLS